MKLRHVAAAVAMWAVGTAASAAVLLNQGFDNVSTLGADGWVIQNLSTPGGTTSWFQGNTGIFSAHSGAANSYIAANFLNAPATGGAISNWLITPELSFVDDLTLALQARTAGEGLLDTLEIYYSTSGASTSIADFSLLGSYSSDTDDDWVSLAFAISATGGSGRFAVRYVVDDTNVAGNYVGVDSLSVTSATSTVPTPGSLALAGLALAALGVSSRRKS